MRVKPPERTVSMTLLPGGVGAGFPHPVLVMGVVILVASGEGVLDGLGEAEEDELQPAVSSAHSARKMYHRFVPALDMLCITCPLLFHFPPVVEWITEPFVQCVDIPRRMPVG